MAVLSGVSWRAVGETYADLVWTCGKDAEPIITARSTRDHSSTCDALVSTLHRVTPLSSKAVLAMALPRKAAHLTVVIGSKSTK